MNPKTIELVLRQFAFLFIIWMIGLELLGWFAESVKNDSSPLYEFLNRFGATAWVAVVVIYFLWKGSRIIKFSK